MLLLTGEEAKLCHHCA